ncbi:hypothetical protein FRB91_004802 [Serendipita sp. 411]|nr:hypothetical protein FRC15_010869 [Serendipita sp. 397]KAG8841639.1 hypothetical protein FRB91_004802 [Serendipita sp. 411]
MSSISSQQQLALLANMAQKRGLTNQLYEEEFKDEYEHTWWSATYVASFQDSNGNLRHVPIGICRQPHCFQHHAHDEATRNALNLLKAKPTNDELVTSKP